MDNVIMRNREDGSAIVETALLVPWLFFLFIGVLDLGFYAYAAICTQNAARAAAVQGAEELDSTPTSPVSGAVCDAALGELNRLPNWAAMACPAPTSVDSTHPFAITAQQLTNVSSPVCADCGATPTAKSYRAAVTYQSVQLIPLPGLLMGRMTLTRTGEVRYIQ
jgi:Flp pilus assembly protein TadG